MSTGGNKGGGGDEPDKYREDADAKSSAILGMHTRLKIAFRGSDFAAREGERNADLAKRPNKDAAYDIPTDKTPNALPQTTTVVKKKDDDDGDSDGDTGSSGSGSSSGGGPAPNLDLTTSDYTPFADVAEANPKNDKAAKKAVTPILKVDTAENATKVDAKGTAPKASAPKAGGPSAPGKSGGGKGGGGSAPSGP